MASSSPRFALIGAAGFVAPRHLQAIKDVGGVLVAALDPHDSVGVLDRFGFRDTEFFADEHRFERFLAKLRHDGNGIDWLSVCSPNYLHDTHIRMGLHVGARVICEKPLVLNPENLAAIEEGHPAGPNVFTVLQLRHVEVLQFLHTAQSRAALALTPHPSEVMLRYITPRGRWYHQSWKGNEEKSGGLITNIGIHTLDLLLWIWGPCADASIYNRTPTRVSGSLRLERADVRFVLSVEGTEAERVLFVNGAPLDFTDGFEGLHSTVYRETLAGHGHTINDARPAIELAWKLRALAE